MASGARPWVPPVPANGTVPPSLGADDGPRVETCTNIDTRYDVGLAAVFSLYILFGLLYTFLGYRCFKTIMFLTGFIFASTIVYQICLQGDLLPSYGNTGVAILAGVLFGLITMLVQYVGLFMTGLHTGLLLGLASLLVADYFMETSPKGSVWLCVAVLLGAALLLAILNLYFRKGLTVLGSSLYGGAILSAAVDYFVEHLSMVSWVWQRVSLRPVEPPPCWYSWIVLAAWPTFVMCGIMVQCSWTGRGTHHADMAAGRKKQRGTPATRNSSSKVDRAELRQKKYRYLYQVRTAHGDVISQNFVQQLQKKDDSHGGECSTLQSDATHLTILPDQQLSVLTESEDDSQSEIPTRR